MAIQVGAVRGCVQWGEQPDFWRGWRIVNVHEMFAKVKGPMKGGVFEWHIEGPASVNADGSGAGQQVLVATGDPSTVLTSDDFEGFGAAAQQPLEVKQPDIMTGADGGFFA